MQLQPTLQVALCGPDSYLPRDLCGRTETEPSPPDSHVRAHMAPQCCPPAIWVPSMSPAQDHNWAFTAIVIWRSLGQNNFLRTSPCRSSPCRTATLVHYQLRTNLQPRCEMEKRAPVIPETVHRSFPLHRSYETNPVSATPMTKDDTIAEFTI